MSNIKPSIPVFDVDIVAPLETLQPPATKNIQPDVPADKPLIQRQQHPRPDEKIRPQTLFGEGNGASPHINNRNTAFNKEEKLGSPPLKKGEGEGFSDEKEDVLSAKDSPSVAPPSALFDRQTIENYAKKEHSQDIPTDRKLTFEMPGFKHRGYMRMLKERIESVWQYPKEAARLGLSGDLYIKFTIKRDGKLGEVELTRTSGHKDLDEAAMKALRDAEPFWPLPEDWEKDDLEINGYFIYIFGNAIVM